MMDFKPREPKEPEEEIEFIHPSREDYGWVAVPMMEKNDVVLDESVGISSTALEHEGEILEPVDTVPVEVMGSDCEKKSDDPNYDPHAFVRDDKNPPKFKTTGTMRMEYRNLHDYWRMRR